MEPAAGGMRSTGQWEARRCVALSAGGSQDLVTEAGSSEVNTNRLGQLQECSRMNVRREHSLPERQKQTLAGVCGLTLREYFSVKCHRESHQQILQ